MTPERSSVLHSWCVQADWDAPTIAGGQGAWFWDEGGRRYLDMSSLSECMTLGHQHPALIRAIREQAEKLCYASAAWGAEPRARLAELLLEKSGFEGGRVYFTLGGADANEHAVKFARQAAGKPRGWVITRDRSYHGATYGAMALSGDTRTRSTIDPRDLRVVHVPPPYAYRCPFAAVSDVECGERSARQVGHVIDEYGAGEVAAVLMEANAGTNGIVAPDSYWPLLREETHRRGVALIADEVMSGFGRCGEWFAWQRSGDAGRPDLMTLAKGLTGAHLPLGAVVMSREIAARLEHEMLIRDSPTAATRCRARSAWRRSRPTRMKNSSSAPVPLGRNCLLNCARCRTASRSSATSAGGTGSSRWLSWSGTAPRKSRSRRGPRATRPSRSSSNGRGKRGSPSPPAATSSSSRRRW